MVTKLSQFPKEIQILIFKYISKDELIYLIDYEEIVITKSVGDYLKNQILNHKTLERPPALMDLIERIVRQNRKKLFKHFNYLYPNIIKGDLLGGVFAEFKGNTQKMLDNILPIISGDDLAFVYFMSKASVSYRHIPQSIKEIRKINFYYN